MEVNKTCSIVDLPEGKKAIGCMWVYKLKFNSDSTIELHKAKLVALGNQEQEGTDYDQNFAPVIKMTTVRRLLKVAAVKN